MTVPTPAPPAEPTPPAAQPPEPTPPVEDTTDWKAESRKWEQRNKDNKTALDALTKTQRAALPEAEKAIADAKDAGRAEARAEYGQELARTQFDALAGRRNAEYDTAKALKYIDLASLLGEDGRPDPKAIKDAVEDLIPVPEGGPPSFDGGTRTTAPVSTGMNGLIRKAAGRA